MRYIFNRTWIQKGDCPAGAPFTSTINGLSNDQILNDIPSGNKTWTPTHNIDWLEQGLSKNETFVLLGDVDHLIHLIDNGYKSTVGAEILMVLSSGYDAVFSSEATPSLVPANQIKVEDVLCFFCRGPIEESAAAQSVSAPPSQKSVRVLKGGEISYAMKAAFKSNFPDIIRDEASSYEMKQAKQMSASAAMTAPKLPHATLDTGGGFEESLLRSAPTVRTEGAQAKSSSASSERMLDASARSSMEPGMPTMVAASGMSQTLPVKLLPSHSLKVQPQVALGRPTFLRMRPPVSSSAASSSSSEVEQKEDHKPIRNYRLFWAEEDRKQAYKDVLEKIKNNRNNKATAVGE